MKVNMGQQVNDLLLDDLEQLLREIEDFSSGTGNSKPLDLPQSLENYLQFVAKSGNVVFPWPHVRSLFRTKMMNAIQQFQEPTCPIESFVLERFDLFRLAAPFTVQRLTELILQPTRHYRKKEKFLRGLEKTVLVVSTVEPRSLNSDAEKNGNEVCEEDTGNNAFNRTFPVNRADVLSVRTSSIDLIAQSLPLPMDSTDSIALDPVTTSTITAAVEAIDPNITVPAVAADVIIPESGSDATVVVGGEVDLIASDIAIAVSSESIILDAMSDAPELGLVSIEAEDTVEMECESSSDDITTVSEIEVASDDLISGTLEEGQDQDLVSAAITAQAPSDSEGVSGIEDVSSTLVNTEGELILEDNAAILVDTAETTPTGTGTDTSPPPVVISVVGSVSDSDSNIFPECAEQAQENAEGVVVIGVLPILEAGTITMEDPTDITMDPLLDQTTPSEEPEVPETTSTETANRTPTPTLAESKMEEDEEVQPQDDSTEVSDQPSSAEQKVSAIVPQNKIEDLSSSPVKTDSDTISKTIETQEAPQDIETKTEHNKTGAVAETPIGEKTAESVQEASVPEEGKVNEGLEVSDASAAGSTETSSELVTESIPSEAKKAKLELEDDNKNNSDKEEKESKNEDA